MLDLCGVVEQQATNIRVVERITHGLKKDVVMLTQPFHCFNLAAVVIGFRPNSFELSGQGIPDR